MSELASTVGSMGSTEGDTDARLVEMRLHEVTPAQMARYHAAMATKRGRRAAALQCEAAEGGDAGVMSEADQLYAEAVREVRGLGAVETSRAKMMRQPRAGHRRAGKTGRRSAAKSSGRSDGEDDPPKEGLTPGVLLSDNRTPDAQECPVDSENDPRASCGLGSRRGAGGPDRSAVRDDAPRGGVGRAGVAGRGDRAGRSVAGTSLQSEWAGAPSAEARTLINFLVEGAVRRWMDSKASG